MNRRYFSAPVVGYEYWDQPNPRTTVTIYEEDRSAPVKTGLLDASGHPIVRMDSADPIGFVHFQPGDS